MISEDLKHYLRGLKHAHPAALRQLQHVSNWDELAQQELQRRASDLLQNLHVELLGAVACSDLDVAAAIAQVMDER